RKAGNSVFVDAGMRPYDDQWAYLSSLPRLSAAAVTKLVEAAERHDILIWKQPVIGSKTDFRPPLHRFGDQN
ncbi:hypothetical protein F9L04_26430, partial [Brucella anthropi]